MSEPDVMPLISISSSDMAAKPEQLDAAADVTRPAAGSTDRKLSERLASGRAGEPSAVGGKRRGDQRLQRVCWTRNTRSWLQADA